MTTRAIAGFTAGLAADLDETAQFAMANKNSQTRRYTVPQVRTQIDAATSRPLGVDASGSNVAATAVTIKAPRSTGNAAPAKLILQTTNVGGSGSSLQTLENILTLDNRIIAVGQDASGSDVAAPSITVTGPRSTGNAAPGKLIFQTTHVGGSGSSAQTLETVLTLEDRAVTITASTALGATGSFGGGVLVVFIANATTVPTSNPSGGGILYAEGGAVKWRGSAGSISTLAPA